MREVFWLPLQKNTKTLMDSLLQHVLSKVNFLFCLVSFLFISVVGNTQCPTAAFNLNPSKGCAIPHTIFFTDQSTTPDKWLWDFGDGSTSTLQNPVHNYVTTGSFTVTLTVTDTILGCSDQISHSVGVSITTADFSPSTSFGCGPLPVNFSDISNSLGGAIASWSWNFGDGNTSSQQNPSHLYDAPGLYDVSLTIIDTNGCSSTETKSSFIQVIGPNVNFSEDAIQACNSLAVNFSDLTIFGAPITSWTWDFGDGNNSNNQNPSHTFNTPGTFDVSLTITDIDGCFRTFVKPQLINVLDIGFYNDLIIECDSLVWIDGNTYYSSNNTATHIIPGGAANGCDSIITLDLTINYSTNGIDSRVECDSLIWIDGNTYYTDNNTATHVLTNANGCDSTIQLNLTINNSISSIDSRTECDSLFWIDGNTYFTNNNLVTHTIISGSSNGCDSTILLDLNIINSSTYTQIISECYSYVWPLNNTTYSTTGTYFDTILNAVGCDSIVTLDLTISDSNVTNLVENTCDSLLWNETGVTYFSSGVYQNRLLNVNNCDSIINLDLTIRNASSYSFNDTVCNSYTWSLDGNTYTTSGSYTVITTNVLGCDSVVTLNLFVNPNLSPTITLEDSMTVCDDVNQIDINPTYGGNYNYLWNTNDTTPNLTSTSPGIFWVEATNYDCILRDSILVKKLQSFPVYSSIASESCIGAFDGAINLMVDGNLSDYSFKWNNGASQNYVNNLMPGFYTVEITNSENCSIDKGYTVPDGLIYCDEITPHSFVPSAFSPNHDGENDILFVRGNGIKSFEFEIYDRLGNKVFFSDNLNFGWNGTYNGKESFTGVYQYRLVATFINQKEEIKYGQVTLIR